MMISSFKKLLMGSTESKNEDVIIPKKKNEFESLEKLANILESKSPDIKNAVQKDKFVTLVFPSYTDLGNRLFEYFHKNSKGTHENYLYMETFRQQCQDFVELMDDSNILNGIMKMYCIQNSPDCIDEKSVKHLLKTCFYIATQKPDNTENCHELNATLESVARGIFIHDKPISLNIINKWFQKNFMRPILLLHKYSVHILSTAYRYVQSDDQSNDSTFQTTERGNSFYRNTTVSNTKDALSIQMSLPQAWLLASVLPLSYSKTQYDSHISKNSSAAINLSVIPSHWTLLYNSSEHGLATNRFLHHVLGYRGPTLIFLNTGDNETYILAATNEWKERNIFMGGENCQIIKLLPTFLILEKGSDLFYLNTSIRGHAKGLLAGSDTKNATIAIDEHFEKIKIHGKSTKLFSIKVWGCGDKTSNEILVNFKKWKIKEAERQRTVKLTSADWMNHPDRYLLELGGRQSYNN